MATNSQRPSKEKRRRYKLIFIERRKGKLWLYGQMVLLPVLLATMMWLYAA
jgi:hypothetical protein